MHTLVYCCYCCIVSFFISVQIFKVFHRGCVLWPYSRQQVLLFLHECHQRVKERNTFITDVDSLLFALTKMGIIFTKICFGQLTPKVVYICFEMNFESVCLLLNLAFPSNQIGCAVQSCVTNVGTKDRGHRERVLFRLESFFFFLFSFP